MEQETIKPFVKLWEGTKNFKYSTKVFSPEEINLIFKTLKNSKDYWVGKKTERFKKGHHLSKWGEFFRMRDLTLLYFIYYEALRPKECCLLKFNDINFKEKTIFINGKNNKIKRDRIVLLSKQIVPVLQEYLSFHKKFWKNSPYLFPSFQNEYISPSTLKTIIREKVLKKCGLYEPVDIQRGEAPKSSRTRLYSLRKSRASHILNQSKDIFLVSNILGHKDIRTTANYYIHTSKDYQSYMQKNMDGEIEALQTPNIQIKQTNNIMIQQINNLIVQNQEILKMIFELMKTQNYS